MTTGSAEYFYTTDKGVNATTVLVLAVALLTPCIYVGFRFWWLLGFVPGAIIVPLLLIYWDSNRVDGLRASTPALSMLESGLSVRIGRKVTFINYANIKSIIAETGRGYRYLTISHHTAQNIEELHFNAAGINASLDEILHEVAQRLPVESHSRIGPGVLLCSTSLGAQRV
ncbi:MAG: hypothetical protein EKK46_07385 [Rhodocyclaceae bacterium]|nr:MAG: hypothetical protein EKK46_07385 [Rhodocyclaceae bacterium]